MMFWRSVGVALVIVVSSSQKAASASDDAWLVTKARMLLLTAEGVRVRDLDVQVDDGAVTLHGNVRTGVEKERAGHAVGALKGVTRVSNLMRVWPQAFNEGPRMGDDTIRSAVVTRLKADRLLGGVTVTSVSNGVVLLGGTTVSAGEKRRAIELAWDVAGVSRVVSRIGTER